MAKSFKPPQSVQNNAKRGLELREKYGRGGLTTKEAGNEGIGSGVARARDLANGKNVSLETIRRMVNFFNRHEKNKDTPPEKGNGKIAWLLWGGDSGRSWAESILKKEDKEEKAMYSPSAICLILEGEQAELLIDGLRAIGIEPDNDLITDISIEYYNSDDPHPTNTQPLPMALYQMIGKASTVAPIGLNIIESIVGLEGQDTEILALYARPDGQFYANVRGLVSQATIDAIKQVLPGMVEIKAETEPDGNGWTQIWPGMVGKAGARNSRMDKGRIQKAHDLLCELGAECKKPEAHPTKPNPIKIPRQNYKSLIQLSEALTKAK